MSNILAQNQDEMSGTCKYMKKNRNEYKILITKPQEKKPFGKQGCIGG
jgi:hypothetical protein